MIQAADILLTGASGFLGRAVLQELRESGYRVVALTHRPVEQADTLSVAADLRDSAALAAAVEGFTFRCIVHLAAALPGKTANNSTVSDNHAMTLALLALATERRICRFVLASGCNVYGKRYGPCRESTKPLPNDEYAAMKLADEAALFDTVSATGMTAAALRVSAPYGPRPSRFTVVNVFLQQAAKGENITVFGTGARQQHFVHQSDVALAFRLASEADSAGCFNISGPEPATMLELAEACARLFGNRCPVVTVGDDPQEDYRGNFPWQRANALLGYSPRLALGEGLRQTASAMGLL